jgi:hypothetical protein
MVETTRGIFSITVRENVGDQIDVEIVSSHGEEIPDSDEEKRRWTYSTWKPGEPSPSTGEKIREVRIAPAIVLGIAANERRVLLHDDSTGMVHLIPVTNFYNELMLHKQIRTPEIALNASRLFSDLDWYSEEDLRAAFIAYNKLKRRVKMEIQAAPEKPARFLFRVKSLLGKKRP